MTEIQVYVGEDRPGADWKKWDIVAVHPDAGGEPVWGIRESIETWELAKVNGWMSRGVPVSGPFPSPFAILKCPALDYTKAQRHLERSATVDDIDGSGKPHRRMTHRRRWRLRPANMTQAERNSILDDQVRSVSLPKFRSWTIDQTTNRRFNENDPDGQGQRDG